MRIAWWVFTAIVAAALMVNLALVSARVSQNTEEALRSRVTVASAALRTQMELLDLRSSPQKAAFSPDLIEATRPPPDAAQPPARPDERALRAAAAALQPEPDLLVVANAHGAAMSRRGKAATFGEDPARLPMLHVALESGAPPQFITFEGSLYHAAAARIPGNAAVVMAGTRIDDRVAAQLRTQLDADVSFFHEGNLLASSLGKEDRAAVAVWATKPPTPGFGSLRVALPVVGSALADQLPLGAPRASTRASIVSLAPTVQAVVSVPAAAYFVWLARYQAFYFAAWILFVLVAFIFGAFAGRARTPSFERAPERASPRVAAEELRPAAAASGGHEPLDPDLAPAPARVEEHQLGPLGAAAGREEPMWSAESLPRSEGHPAAQSVPTPTEPLVADVTGRFSTPPPAAASPSADEPMLPDSVPGPAQREDEEEAHLRETFDKFLALRAETGESVHLSYDRFATKLRQNRDQLLARGNVRAVRFTVYKKDGRAAIKASAVR
jgi:hypothetical protein